MSLEPQRNETGTVVDKPSVDARLMDLGDGAMRFARHWSVPRADDVVLMLHGVESHSEWFSRVAEGLQSRGMAAFAVDRRGFGQSPGRRGHTANVRAVLAEVDQTVQWLARSYQRIHMAGLSWGGLLAAAYRERHGDKLASVSLLVPGLFPAKKPSTKHIAAAAVGLRSSVPLPLTIADFATDAAAQAYIAADVWRVTDVSLAFLKTTARLFPIARSLSRREPPTEILLASSDRVIDTERTAALAEKRRITVHRIPDTVHSLVLETPIAVVDRIAALVTRGAAPLASPHTAAHAS